MCVPSKVGTKVDLSLLDHVLIPYNWSEYLYHVGCSLFLHSIIHSGLIAEGKGIKEGRQAVFFTALDPLRGLQKEEYQDLSKVHDKSKWKVFQDALFWINLGKAQDKGLFLANTIQCHYLS